MNPNDPIFVKPTYVWVSRAVEATDEEIRAIVGNPEVEVVRYGGEWGATEDEGAGA